MVTPLIETKLHAPSPRPHLVVRDRLATGVERAARTRLTLVSAPAGFGKTTLVAEWLRALAERGAATAWLSLDERDNDPLSFWSYVVAALQTAVAQP